MWIRIDCIRIRIPQNLMNSDPDPGKINQLISEHHLKVKKNIFFIFKSVPTTKRLATFLG